jgi:hypothetical protein
MASSMLWGVSMVKFDGSTWAGATQVPSYVGVAVFAGLLFAVGRNPENGCKTFNSVERFDGGSRTSAPSLVAKRYGPGVTVFKGLLQAVGGHDASTTGC